MAFIKNHDNVLFVHLVGLILLDERIQLLNGSDDDPALWILQLLRQDFRIPVSIGSALLETVILLNGLVIQILPVHHKKDLVNVRQFRSQTGGLKGCQCLPGACGMPDIAPRLDSAHLLVIIGHLDTVQNGFRSGDLVRPHNHEKVFRSENAVPGQYGKEGMFGKEGLGEIYKVENVPISPICPMTGELKGIAGFSTFLSSRRRFLFDMAVPGCIGIILRISAIGNDKNLHIFIEAGRSPEGIPLVPLDLVESLTDGHTSPLELHMHQRKAVHQNGHIITGLVASLFLFVLVNHLELVVMNMFLVQKINIFCGSIVSAKELDIVLLDFPRFLHNSISLIGNAAFEKAIPFLIGKLDVIQLLQLPPQIGNKILLVVNSQVLIALLFQLLNKRSLQLGLTLVMVGMIALLVRRIFRHHRVPSAFHHHVIHN